MTPALDRKEIVALVEEVMAAGARQAAACAELGRDARTLQRWKSGLPFDLGSRSSMI